MPEELNLSNLQPAQPRKERKRVGRGLGSGKGRYSGRGIKGQKSRAGSHRMRAGFEGGQMPLAMRLPKLRGNTSRDAMPVGPFRTYTQPVNIRDLDRFEAGEEVTPETLKAKGLIRSIRKDVKLLGVGELTKKLTITVHGASATAREKVEAAGGTLTLLKEPKVKKADGKHRTAPVRVASRDRRGHRDRGARCRGRGPRPSADEPRERGVALVLLARQRLAGSGASAPGAVHGVHPRGLPPRLVDPGAGRQRLRDRGPVRQRRLQPAEPLQRRRARPLLDLRARDHAVRHGVDRDPAPHRRRAAARAAQARG